jgi:transcriptional regulator with XRE-family HTH domain
MSICIGEIIRQARQNAGLSRAELAAHLWTEGGRPFTARRVGAIERGARRPLTHHLLRQLARELGLPYEYLAHLSNTYPEDLHDLDVEPERVEAAFAALRRVLTGTGLS